MADAGSCTDNLGATSEDKKSRGISVDAAPFTPRSRIVSSVLSPLAPEFYPRNYVALSQNEVLKTDTEAEASLLVEVKQTIATLVQRPEDFDQVMGTLASSLTGSIHDDDALMSVVREIVSESVYNANFCYIGARICWHLCQHLKFHFGSFQDHLYQRCMSECTSICDISMDESTKEELSRLTDFTLFLAELLFNMKDSSESQFLLELPGRIAELLLKLVNVGTAESLQGAVQVLKLAGAVLESRSIDLNLIFSKLQECDQNSELIRFMISSVTAQRAANWGQADGGVIVSAGAGDTTNSMCADESLQPMDGSVFYEPNSQMYGIPEAADDFDSFVGWHASGGNNVHVNNNVQYWIGDQVMDADTANAFEEFMAGSELHPVPNFWCYQQP